MDNWLPITFAQHQEIHDVTDGLMAELLKHCEGEEAEFVEPEWMAVAELVERLGRLAETIESQGLKVVP